MSRRLPSFPARLPRPGRPVVCASCRTALMAEEACDLCFGEGQAFHLGRRRDRRAFVDEVWGKNARNRQGLRGEEPGLDEMLADENVSDLEFVLWIARTLRRRLFASKPRGVRRGLEAPKRSRAFVGVARRIDDVQLAPLSGRRCLAFGVLFTHLASVWRSAVTLRDAMAVEFDIELNDGSIVRIRAGRVRLSLRATETVRPRRRALREYMTEVDPLFEGDEALPPFPFQRVGEVLVRPGQKVEVRGDFEPQPDPRAGARGLSYRSAPATILVATGVPWLRVRT